MEIIDNDPTLPYNEGGRDFDAEDEARQNLTNKYNQQVTTEQEEPITDKSLSTISSFNIEKYKKSVSELVAVQKMNFSEWYSDDKQFANRLIIDQDFKRVSDKHVWEYANFSSGKSVEFPEPRIGKKLTF